MKIDPTKKSVAYATGNGWLKCLFLAVACFQFQAFAAKTITLAWDPSPDVNVTGYKVYYGTASGNYSSVVTVANVTQATIPGLIEGVTYYFTITAFNPMGLESEPSEEISYAVPMPQPVSLRLRSLLESGVLSLALFATGTVGEQWIIESSVDLRIWTDFTNGTGPVDLRVPGVGEPNRFFRFKQQ